MKDDITSIAAMCPQLASLFTDSCRGLPRAMRRYPLQFLRGQVFPVADVDMAHQPSGDDGSHAATSCSNGTSGGSGSGSGPGSGPGSGSRKRPRPGGSDAEGERPSRVRFSSATEVVPPTLQATPPPSSYQPSRAAPRSVLKPAPPGASAGAGAGVGAGASAGGGGEPRSSRQKRRGRRRPARATGVQFRRFGEPAASDDDSDYAPSD